jgi:hypothetical protein
MAGPAQDLKVHEVPDAFLNWCRTSTSAATFLNRVDQFIAAGLSLNDPLSGAGQLLAVGGDGVAQGLGGQGVRIPFHAAARALAKAWSISRPATSLETTQSCGSSA